MTARRTTEVVVAGAGPAGAVTAAALARSGLAVLLVADDAHAEDHDMLVSGQALRSLTAAGLPAGQAARPVQVIRLSFGGRAGKSITDAGVAVASRSRLRETLRRTAVTAGAVEIRGKVTSTTRTAQGYEVGAVLQDGTPTVITAAHVVSATGSGPQPDGPSAFGAACSRRFTGVTLRRRVVLTMTAPAMEPGAQPTCVWALPGGHQTVTVTAASGGSQSVLDPASLMDAALQTLAGADARFAAATPAGPLVTGLLDAGYSPQRVGAADHLLVGDSAGLVNPFTGEGLSYAVRSGLLAARSIARYPSDPDAAHRDYAHRLSAGFVGFFETARHAVRRYHLTWRVLAASAHSDHPFFAKARRATLLPEGLSGLAPVDHVELPPRETIMVAPFLMACDEVAVAMIRTEWPFLARLMAAEDDDQVRLRLRPAVVFFAALLAEGGTPDPGRAAVAAGIELAHLGALSLLGPPPAGHVPRRGVDWPVATTILAGDFLLAQATRLVAESAPGISWAFADWLAELTHLRAARLEADGAGVPAGAMFASLLEFPARIGGLLGGARAGTVRALRDFGHHCGTAFAYADDHLALRGERTRLDVTLPAMLAGRISAIPDCLGRPDVTVHDLAEPRLRAVALAASARACHAARRQALHAAAEVPDPAAALILRRFATAVARPVGTVPVSVVGTGPVSTVLVSAVSTGLVSASPAR